MRADLWLTIAKDAQARGHHLIARSNDVVDLIAHMMNAACGVLFEKAVDGAVVAKRVEQLDLGVWQFDKDNRDAMIRLILRCTDICAKRRAVLVCGGF